MLAHGLMGKNVFFEESIRVPFMVRIPCSLAADPGSGGPILQYGHGLFGSYDEARTGYLGELIGRRLMTQDVSPDGVVYRTTDKGREFLLYYNRLTEFLEEPQVELSAPYIRQ